MDADIAASEIDSPITSADSGAGSLRAAELGFEEVPDDSIARVHWSKSVGGAMFAFRIPRTLEEYGPAEILQRDVLGTSDLDTMPANGMLTIPETGGDVIGAYVAQDGAEQLVGASFSYGGFLNRTPRFLSEMLVVRADQRSRGLGAELKKLQAVVALERGFREIVWTVDPLRAANARLNFEKLGAVSDHFEVNRYGDTYGAGLYGGMPTDRLHIRWRPGELRARQRLLGQTSPSTRDDIDDLLHFDPGRLDAERAFIYMPADIDALVSSDLNAAMRWRLTMRETLQSALAAGYEICGFVPNVLPERELSALIIQKKR